MKIRKVFLFSIILLMFCSTLLQAQVTIGSGNQPKDYTILQIDGVGGLRLPKLNNAQRTAMETAGLGADAKGLVIYFEDGANSSFQYWDGKQWVALKYMDALLNAQNGISDTKTYSGDDEVKQVFRLGGTLTEETVIKQPTAKLLKFNPVDGGTITVMHNALVVNENSVGMGKAPTGALLDVTGDQGKAFRYKTPTVEKDQVLAADSKGNAIWRTTQPKAELEGGTMKIGQVIAKTDTNFVEVTNPLSLSKGVWLIMGRYVAKATSITNSEWGYQAWISLRTSDGKTSYTSVGEVPQRANNIAMATPQLVYILSVPATTTYSLFAHVKCANPSNYNMKIEAGNATETGFSYFQAVRLSEDPAN